MVHDGGLYAHRLQGVWVHSGEPVPVDSDYASWQAARRAGLREVGEQARHAALSPFSVSMVVVVLARGDADATRRTLASLRSQTSTQWSAVVVGDDEGIEAGVDGRTAWLPLGPAGAETVSEVLSVGDPRAFVAVVEAGDALEADFVFRVLGAAHDDPNLSLIHWDDDVLADGALTAPRFRPDWSPEMLLGANYLGRSFAVRREALVGAGGLDLRRGDAAWWDLLLRLDLDAGAVGRITRVLAHVRRRPVTSDADAVTVVSEHLARRGRVGTVEPAFDGVRVHWEVPEPPHVTVIIPTRHNRANLATLLPTLATTDYPSFDVRIVDNGGRSTDRQQWYAEQAGMLDHEVIWWDEPFNFGRVNNVAASGARGEVLVFLNDDTEILDPGWLTDVVGWATQPEIGLVGLQLLGPDGAIQHGGVVIGMSGFADHLFEGCPPIADTLIGPTWWYRNSLSVTAACVAVRRALFERIGGFDERFVLCGSDVVLGLDARFAGHRNVVLPFPYVRHLESATRGSSVPESDFHASYWNYQKYLRGGDPYFSPNLSLQSRVPALRSLDEPSPMEHVGEVLDRSFTVFRQRASEDEALHLADSCRADDALVERVEAAHASVVGPAEVATVNWHLPDIDSPFYGGIATALRIADELRREHGVENRFVVTAHPNELFFRSALEAGFPGLADSDVHFIDGSTGSLDGLPAADAAVATLWTTAYQVARADRVRRRFYLIQDFEPMFYPAGTNYALAEEGYRLGLYGLCNTTIMRDLYRVRYAGTGWAFVPAVDDAVFHAEGRRPIDHDGPATVFVYARPGHWRNCWELASLALAQLKERLGDRVRIVTAGSWARPEDLGSGIEHLGLLDLRDTGELYRSCDLGVALTVSEHPSYLPGELMACGVPVVAYDNAAGDWILHHEENSLRSRRTVDGLAQAMERLATEPALRARLSKGALETVAEHHSDWSSALAGVHGFLVDPDAMAAAQLAEAAPWPRPPR
jgi:GT2 family glycosyltransferase/glycosyltransferase involved in cell wall biosynthesis